MIIVAYGRHEVLLEVIPVRMLVLSVVHDDVTKPDQVIHSNWISQVSLLSEVLRQILLGSMNAS